MNTIDVKKKDIIDDKLCYGILVDKVEVLSMYVSITDNVATITYNGRVDLFRGFTGALLLKELLSYVLFTIDGVIEVRTYFDDNNNNYGLSNYCKQFNCNEKRLEDGSICYFIKK